MTYHEAENYLLSLGNMPRREYMADPRECLDYLKRLQFFLDILGNPERKIPHYIHVTGTSGKGSVCSYLQSILQADQQPVGLYVSPHPSRLLERWKVNNQYMSEREFIAIVECFKPKLEEYLKTSPYDMVSFFDISTAIALDYFAAKKVKWAVMEVGCGGRYDSTNVIPKKDIAVITTIGLDHTEVLGDTKVKIAYEKAGIIKPGCRVFTTETNRKVVAVIKKECRVNKAKLQQLTKNIKINRVDADGTQFSYREINYKLKIPGQHQIKNAALAIECAEALNIPTQAIQTGLITAEQPLRFEIISRKPMIILDGAHNPDKIKTTVKTVKMLRQTRRPDSSPKGSPSNTHIIVAFSADKPIIPMIKSLATLAPATIICTRQAINPFRKVADPTTLAKLFKKYSPKSRVEVALDPLTAYASVTTRLKKHDILLITGSIFLSGELRQRLTK